MFCCSFQGKCDRSTCTWTDYSNAYIFRLINTTTVCSSKVNDISRKLGIPLRPKKPLPGYLRFMKEIQPSIKSSVKSPREIPVVVAARWKALGDSEKAKYHEQFEKEKVHTRFTIIKLIQLTYIFWFIPACLWEANGSVQSTTNQRPKTCH